VNAYKVKYEYEGHYLYEIYIAMNVMRVAELFESNEDAENRMLISIKRIGYSVIIDEPPIGYNEGQKKLDSLITKRLSKL
jgi:hypothetical protein